MSTPTDWLQASSSFCVTGPGCPEPMGFPLIRVTGQALGLDVASESALAAGLVMGMMIIPFVSPLSDDVITAVPQSLRDGSLGLGATKSETIKRVILPAALPGIVSAFMLAISRAVGETMIVLMAAGNTPLIGWNVFNGFQTLSAAIATELPEAARGGTHYRVLFLAALVLFAMTFVVNTAAEIVRQRFRRRAHEL